MIIAIGLVKEDVAFMRTLLYIIAGSVLTAKSRKENNINACKKFYS